MFPSHPIPSLSFLRFLPYMHVIIVFSWHCNHTAARCSQDGIIRENVCAAYFSQGLSLANYSLDGSQRFSPITCIFPFSRVDAGQGSARTVSVVLSLAVALPMSRAVAHSSSYYKYWQVNGLNYMEGTPHVPLLSQALRKRIVCIAQILKVSIICLALPRISGQPFTSPPRAHTCK